jgi:energy-coupling factor transporter transmembrane protein EcfT
VENLSKRRPSAQALLVSFLLFSAAIMQSGWIGLGLGAGLVFLGFALSPLSLLASLKKSRGLASLALFIAATRALANFAALPLALRDIARLLLVFLAGEFFFELCPPERAGRALTRFCRKLPGLRRRDPGVALSLCLSFFPRSLALFRQAFQAAKLRGYGRRGIKLGATVIVLSSLVVAALRRALETSQALTLRGYSPERTIENEPFAPLDLAFLLPCLLLLGLSAPFPFISASL